MTLEEEVTQLMQEPVKAAPSVLEAQLSGGPLDLSLQGQIALVFQAIEGHRRAIRRIAREIDESRGA